MNLLTVSFCESVFDLYQRTYDIKGKKSHLLSGSYLLHDLLSSLKVILPTSILYYFLLQTIYCDSYFSAIECAVKMAVIRVVLGSLERWVVR